LISSQFEKNCEETGEVSSISYQSENYEEAGDGSLIFGQSEIVKKLDKSLRFLVLEKVL
jgi:hypothetical protein